MTHFRQSQSNPPEESPSLRIPRPATARELAISVLWEADETGRFASDLLDEQCERSTWEPRERGLALELVAGVVRRQLALEAVIRPHLSRNWDELEAGLQRVLQLGAYQLLYCDGIPPHAAVHETVQLCHRASQPRWTGFVNGVLRSVSRALTETVATSPRANCLPVTEGQYRQLTVRPFPDPGVAPARYFSQAFSFPEWLAIRWAERFPWDELLRLGMWCNQSPRLCLRVNLRKTTREEFLATCAAAEIAVRPGDRPEAVWLEAAMRVTELPGFTEGWFAVQDESALAAAHLLAPQPQERILDLCAAPGGKTTHLAELAGGEAEILAVDVDGRRLKQVAENARRLGHANITTQLLTRDRNNLPRGPFDAVLVDVPCSNTGVLGKRPEARWRIQPADLVELPQLQLELLTAAATVLKPVGRIVYSTCSIEPEENQQVVAAFLRAHPDFTLRAEQIHLPGQPADGAYQALLARG